MNWPTLSTDSPYKTAVAIQQELQQGRVAEAASGLAELIDALSKSEKRALKSQLVRLMLHILKWHGQPERRSLSWIASIEDARDEIGDIRDETPSLNEQVIKDLWAKAFVIAKRNAEAEMGKRSSAERLTWQEVFDTVYVLDRD
ncbi:DUF29 domain-containing protein [uncultured Thiodictyon sp.]|jgi:hypothetical protein|uniref:DUF29 domain-containing protein n=1 Tax=uncultured Thiodictyon sp. TaxID=1846217 RepID=UPI0025F3F252|nr:DUF29 domain-containing protein [uncultured Thiodictyon sp.]